MTDYYLSARVVLMKHLPIFLFLSALLIGLLPSRGDARGMDCFGQGGLICYCCARSAADECPEALSPCPLSLPLSRAGTIPLFCPGPHYGPDRFGIKSGGGRFYRYPDPGLPEFFRERPSKTTSPPLIPDSHFCRPMMPPGGSPRSLPRKNPAHLTDPARTEPLPRRGRRVLRGFS